MPRIATPSILIAVIFAGLADAADPEALYRLVEIGMPRQQVEAHFGPFEGGTLTYEPGGRQVMIGDDDRFSAEISGSAANEVPVPSGSTRRDVLSLLGPPAKECTRYTVPSLGDRYEFCFADDRLISKAFTKAPTPPPYVHKQTCDVSRMVFFPAASAALNAQSNQTLTWFAKECPPERGRTVYILGHDDSAGSPDTNMATSRARAEAVRAHLIALGYAPDQLRIEAFGNTKRLAREAHDAQNLRVEIVVR
jgi:outer membrane protein OmpA-like peptidoglycan-associated protein